MKKQHDSTKEQQASLAQGLSGQHFGNYDLVRRIDVGGMGEVYLAHQRTAFGREVAVKIIRPDLVHDITVRKRFLREAEVNAHLKHDHILPLIEFSEHEGRLFLVTPYIKGGTLARRLESGSLSLSKVYQLFCALVQAVGYIHKRGVIHRDLKPSNILLDQEEDSDQVYVRLIDFGIATMPGTPVSAPLTAAGHEIGTAAYMAPERLDGIAAPSNDIYSLGMILFQMLTGSLAAYEKVGTLPQSLEYVVQHCVMPHPDNRFSNADELLQTFKRAYQVLTTSSRFQPDAPIVSNIPSSDAPAITAVNSSRLTPSSISYEKTRGLGQPDTPVANPSRSTSGHATPITRDHLLIHRAEVIHSPHIKANGAFQHDDYNASTSFIDNTGISLEHQKFAHEATLGTQPYLSSKAHKRPLLAIISVAIVAILVMMAGMGYMIFQSSISANITITSQVRPISQMLTMTALPTQQKVDVGSSSLPASVLNSNKTLLQDGEATGRVGCIFVVFECKQAVSQADEDMLKMQILPHIKDQIKQDLQQQAQARRLTTVGDVNYIDGNVSANPAVGTLSRTVTVSLTEQGSIKVVKLQDMQDLGRHLLSQQLPAHYQLIDRLTQFGTPLVQSMNTEGAVIIKLPAAGVGQYQLSPQETTDIENHVKGMQLEDARTYIAQRLGMDKKAIGLHISYGDTIPNNIQQIKVASIAPTDPPTVPLPSS